MKEIKLISLYSEKNIIVKDDKVAWLVEDHVNKE